MREYLFQRIIRLERSFSVASAQKNIISKRRRRKLIPDEYFVNVITSIPDRKAVVEMKSIDI
jgi:hypothetical protein